MCQPVCERSCVKGKCVGPDKCSCSTGYAGPRCDEDVNECGFVERPCSHRCMNTHGSYRCYCEPGYTLSADGYTCTNDDECRRGAGVCRPRRTCRNTFGSFVCVCRGGFVMGTLNGAARCRDEDECLIGSHRCSRHAQCVNTDGSHTCRCSEGYYGNGRACRPARASRSRARMYFDYKLSKRTKPRRPSSR
ncbi:nephronectin isoform X2 [Pungitius pungitius]|uniref:nephronectin isoform X2 n=1 Tax=Pungitius pungitius TaxID=134920 RepID=UPI002E13F72F